VTSAGCRFRVRPRQISEKPSEGPSRTCQGVAGILRCRAYGGQGMPASWRARCSKDAVENLGSLYKRGLGTDADAFRLVAVIEIERHVKGTIGDLSQGQ
jgi:hypothetical protein